MRSDVISFLSEVFISSRFSGWILGDLIGPDIRVSTCSFSVMGVSTSLETSSSKNFFFFLLLIVIFQMKSENLCKNEFFEEKICSNICQLMRKKAEKITETIFVKNDRTLLIYNFPASFVLHLKVPRYHKNDFVH